MFLFAVVCLEIQIVMIVSVFWLFSLPRAQRHIKAIFLHLLFFIRVHIVKIAHWKWFMRENATDQPRIHNVIHTTQRLDSALKISKSKFSGCSHHSHTKSTLTKSYYSVGCRQQRWRPQADFTVFFEHLNEYL